MPIVKSTKNYNNNNLYHSLMLVAESINLITEAEQKRPSALLCTNRLARNSSSLLPHQ